MADLGEVSYVFTNFKLIWRNTLIDNWPTAALKSLLPWRPHLPPSRDELRHRQLSTSDRRRWSTCSWWAPSQIPRYHPRKETRMWNHRRRFCQRPHPGYCLCCVKVEITLVVNKINFISVVSVDHGRIEQHISNSVWKLSFVKETRKAKIHHSFDDVIHCIL